MLLRRAELAPGEIRDVRWRDGVIVEIAPEVARLDGEDEIDAGGCVVLPGLHDHHVHLRAQAATLHSVSVGEVADADGLRVVLTQAQDKLRPGAWLRVVGYHESIAGEIDRAMLDDLTVGATPVRVQHRTGVLWVLNSAGWAAAGLDDAAEEGVDSATGRIWRRDDLIGRISALDPDALSRVGSDAAALGITGFTDATPGSGPSHALDLARDLRAAGVAQALLLMGPVGALTPTQPRATLGPVKILLDDHDLPPLEQVVDTITGTHDEQRQVAIHCVTRVQLVLAIAALETAGSQPGDRIEHGSVIHSDVVDALVRLGVTVVTQPHFLTERGDQYRADVDPADFGSLYRLRSLLDAGIPVAAGTDAPFGALDPWASMVAAMQRRTAQGHVIGPDECVDLTTAVGTYLGHPEEPGRARTVAVGAPAGLVGLSVPWRSLPDALADRPVAFTVIDGAFVYCV